MLSKNSTTKYCSIERAASHYLKKYTTLLNDKWRIYKGVLLKFEEDPTQYCFIAVEINDTDIRDCLNEKFNLYREKYYNQSTGASDFYCDWNPKEIVTISPILIFPDAPLYLTFQDLKKEIEKDEHAPTTIEFYNKKSKDILFRGFEGKFLESLKKADPKLKRNPRCCSKGCVVKCSKAITVVINDVYEKLGFPLVKILDDATIQVLDRLKWQSEVLFADKYVLTELNNALIEEDLLGNEVDYEGETNQENVFAAIEEQLILKRNVNESLFATVSESVTITMDLCLEENDIVTAGIPLSPNGTNLIATSDALNVEFNDYINVTIDKEIDVLNVALTNITDGWKKTTLKLFLIYVNEKMEVGREHEARNQTALVKLTKQDCQAVEEKASQSLVQRQDLRNVNIPIVHSKIFYYPKELVDISEDKVEEYRNQSKALMRFFIEKSTEGFNQGLNGFKINSIEYVGLRKVDPDFSNDGDIGKYATGQVSDFVITLYADNRKTTRFKEVFQEITETVTNQINIYINENNISFVEDEDEINEQVLKIKKRKSSRKFLRGKARSFIATLLDITEPANKKDFLWVVITFIGFMVLINFFCVLSLYHAITIKTILWKVIRTIVVAVKSYINYNKVNLAISYATSEGLMYRPDPLVTGYLFVNPFLGILLVGFALSVSLKFDAKGAPFAVVFPLSMCVFICNCLALDIPHIFVTYFYMTRYKPPSLDIRIAAIIDVALSVFLALILLFNQAKSYKLFTDKAGSERLGADRRRYRRRLLQSSIAAMTPFLIILPALKILCTMNTMINTVVGKIELTAYDPKSTMIESINDNGELELKFRENQYGKLRQELTSIEQYVRNNFDTAAFKQRTKDCVISRIGENLQTISIPNPFAEGCLNSVEKLFIAFTFFGLLMMFSFLVFLRYSWPYILEVTKTENFLPVLCGERRGNRRTVATNVREEDIKILFKILDEGGFWTHFFYKIKKPLSIIKREKISRNIQEKLDEEQKIDEAEMRFWKNFSQLKEEPTFVEKIQNLYKKIKCCKSAKVENKTLAKTVETRDTSSGPDLSNLRRLSNFYPLPFASKKLYVYPAIAKRRFDIKRRLRQHKNAITKQKFNKMSKRKQNKAYRRAEVNVIGYETRREWNRWIADKTDNPTLAAIRLEDEPQLERKEAGKLAPVMIETIPVEHRNAIHSLVVDISQIF